MGSEMCIRDSYWVAGTGFIAATRPLKADIAYGVQLEKPVSGRRRAAVFAALVVLAALVIALFVASIVYAAI